MQTRYFQLLLIFSTLLFSLFVTPAFAGDDQPHWQITYSASGYTDFSGGGYSEHLVWDSQSLPGFLKTLDDNQIYTLTMTGTITVNLDWISSDGTPPPSTVTVQASASWEINHLWSLQDTIYEGSGNDGFSDAYSDSSTAQDMWDGASSGPHTFDGSSGHVSFTKNVSNHVKYSCADTWTDSYNFNQLSAGIQFTL